MKLLVVLPLYVMRFASNELCTVDKGTVDPHLLFTVSLRSPDKNAYNFYAAIEQRRNSLHSGVKNFFDI